MGSDGNSIRSTSSAVVLVGAGGASLVPALLNGLGTTFTCVARDSTLVNDPILLEPHHVDLDYTIDGVEGDSIGKDKPMSQRPYGWYQEAFKKGKRRW